MKINKIENIKAINEMKSWAFENINKVDKTLSRLTRKKRKLLKSGRKLLKLVTPGIKTTKIRNERRYIITNFTQIRWIIREYYNFMPTN